MLLYSFQDRRGAPKSPTVAEKRTISDQLTVLVVENNRDQRELLVAALQGNNYRVISAEDGVEALEKLASDRAEIILSDVVMPRMDGFDLVRRIRSDPRFREIYLILVTARRDELDIVRGLELGADDYVIKPYSFFELMARVGSGKRILERSVSR